MPVRVHRVRLEGIRIDEASVGAMHGDAHARWRESTSVVTFWRQNIWLPPMSTPSIEERTEFWKHAYARSSFVDAKLFAEMILSGGFNLNDRIRKSLSVSVLVTYGRPFKQRNRVRISEKIVPASCMATHKDLIVWRDKVIAHRDLDGPVAEWGFVSQLLVSIDSSGFSPLTLSPILSDEKAKETVSLTEHLIREMDTELDAFVRKHGQEFRRESGLYTLNLDADGPDWLLPAAPSDT